MESPSDNTDQSDKSEEGKEELSKSEIDVFLGPLSATRVRSRVFEAATDIGKEACGPVPLLYCHMHESVGKSMYCSCSSYLLTL
jgi:hypothetical protein